MIAKIIYYVFLYKLSNCINLVLTLPFIDFYMKIYTLLFFSFIIISSCNPPLKLSVEGLPNARKMAKALENQSMVVRIPTQGKKIQFLSNALKNGDLDDKTKSNYQKLMEEAIVSDKTYLLAIDSIFRVNYKITPVFFVPDSSFRSFKAGARNVFVDGNGHLIPHPDFTNDYLLLLTDDNKYKFKLFDKDGYRLPNFMPYKRDAFLPFFQILLQKDKYIADQIIYFDSRLNELAQISQQ